MNDTQVETSCNSATVDQSPSLGFSALVALSMVILVGISCGGKGDLSFQNSKMKSIRIELLGYQPHSAGLIEFKFTLKDDNEMAALTAVHLATYHGAKLHVFMYDPGLTEFRHLHATFDGSAWGVSTNLEVNGKYWIRVQGRLQDGLIDFESVGRFDVVNGAAAGPTPPVLADINQGVDGTSRLVLTTQGLRAGDHSELNFEFSRTDFSQPDISEYLGFPAHVIIVSDQGDFFYHVHPPSNLGNTTSPNEFKLYFSFPSDGGYRLWIQFLDAGLLKTVALSTNVGPQVSIPK